MLIRVTGHVWIRLSFLVSLLISAAADLELLQELCVFLSQDLLLFFKAVHSEEQNRQKHDQIAVDYYKI